MTDKQPQSSAQIHHLWRPILNWNNDNPALSSVCFGEAIMALTNAT